MPRIHHWDDDEAPLTESVVIARIESALDHVLEDLGLDKNQSSVKPEKYVFLTIREFSNEDEPVTYSWFKWGASTIEGPGGGSTSQTLETNTTSAEEIIRTDLTEIEEFIKTGDHRLPIKTWWNKEDLDFLERFYEEYAPEEYRQLYLSNIELQRNIEFVQNTVQREANLIGESTYRSVCDNTTGLEQGVSSIDGLSQDYPVVRYFTELFRDIVLSLTEISGDEIETGHKTAVTELADLYDELVWPIVSHRLSIRSVHGPNSNAVRDWSHSNHVRLSEEFQKTKLKEICDAVGLLREHKSYPEPDGEVIPQYDELAVKRVLGKREEIPEVDQFVAEHDIRALGDLIDLTIKYADGAVTYRGIARVLCISPETAFSLLEVLVPIVTEVPEPKTITPEDIDQETRENLLPDNSE